MKGLLWVIVSLICIGCHSDLRERIEYQQVVVEAPYEPAADQLMKRPLDVTDMRIKNHPPVGELCG